MTGCNQEAKIDFYNTYTRQVFFETHHLSRKPLCIKCFGVFCFFETYGETN